MIGLQVKAAREAAGLTQQDLAARVDAAQSTISGIETGVKAPSVDMLLRLSAALSVSVDELTRNGNGNSSRGNGATDSVSHSTNEPAGYAQTVTP